VHVSSVATAVLFSFELVITAIALHIASFIKKALKGGFVWNHGQS
jgi:hypothetical protein